jgi:hypothetical protein
MSRTSPAIGPRVIPRPMSVDFFYMPTGSTWINAATCCLFKENYSGMGLAYKLRIHCRHRTCLRPLKVTRL